MAKKSKQIGRTLYYCISYYQVYIATIKNVIKKDLDAVILLSDAIPNVTNLKLQLEKSNMFSEVHILVEKEFVFKCRFEFKNKYMRLNKVAKFFCGKYLWLESQRKIILYAKEHLEISIKQFENIYVFGEGRSFAPYLHSIGKKFILVEDALNYFQRRKADDIIEINRMSKPRKYYLINKYLDWLGIYYYMGGYSNAISKIEVNNCHNLILVKCAKNKIDEINRQNLINKLLDEDKLKIYNTFMGNVMLNINDKSNCIVLTNPLLFDKLIETVEQAIEIYTQLINEYCIEENIFIKPHPRDSVDYSKLQIKNKNIFIINPFIPSEVFLFNEQLRFNKAIALSSTAIDQAYYATERINLGMEVFKEMKKRCSNKWQ